MSETTPSETTTTKTAPAAAKPASDRPATKKPAKRRVVESEDDCLSASLFALKAGSVENAKKALQELQSLHAETLKFVIACGSIDDALERLDGLTERLQAA